MNSIKSLRAACVLFAGMAVFSCSDSSGGGSNKEEERANFAGKTEDGNDVLVFKEGSLDNILTKTDTIAITDTSFAGTLIFKNMKTDEIPNVGDIIASAATENAPHGFLYKVLGVSTKDGITAVVVRGASLEEAIEDVDFESETEIDFDEEGNPLEMRMKSSNLPAVLMKDYGGSVSKTFEIKDKTIPIGDIGSVGANVKYTATFIWKLKIEKWKLKYGKMSLKQSMKLSLNGDLSGSVDFTKIYKIASVKLPDISFWIGFVPVILTNELSASFKTTGKAQIGIKAYYALEGGNEYGFEYRDGKVYKIDENDFSKTFNYEQYVDGYIRIGILMGLETRLYGFAGMNLGAGPALELSVSGKPMGSYVFDDGFRADYSGYNSIWNDLALNTTDRKSGWNEMKEAEYVSYAINMAKDNAARAKANSTRDIANEAKLSMGLDFSLRLTLRIMSYALLDHEIASTYIPLATLYRTSFLPLVDEPRISASATGFEIKARVERDFLNYPVHKFGFCIEKFAYECKNGGGIRKDFDGIMFGESREYAAVFSDIEPGDYSIRPYFENGIGGTYYDKAFVYQIQPNSSSSITPSSSSDTPISSSSSVLASSSSIVPSSSSNTPAPSSSSVAPPSSSSNAVANSLTDTRDGQVYRTTVIDTQTWMAENLNYNADGSLCYDDDLANCAIYGRLYDWATAMEACPSSWHLPNNEELQTLFRYVDQNYVSDNSLENVVGTALKAKSGWKYDGNGTDEFGFTALAGSAMKESATNYFSPIGVYGAWWSATERNTGYDVWDAYNYEMYPFHKINLNYRSKTEFSLSIRCLKD